ncbi:MAG: histidine--tRNA ligase [Holosporaceae bacterium]|jgi:histidyl-tRNA synthetase|nr:histidine--tRNA ligase [Holosporaceae bacterium]
MSSDISGFPEFLPQEQIAFNGILDKIRLQFEMFGFIPMDTPAVERLSTLLAKGNDNEIYGIYRVGGENGQKNLGLRFDLTVPFARYVVSKCGQLIFPHRRYQISPVWRGERPQSGRYRQFYQCDIDVIGNGELALAHDAEIVYLIAKTLESIGVPESITKINNRKILCGFLKNIISEKIVPEVVRIIDKAEKISPNEFAGSLETVGMSAEGVATLLDFMGSAEKYPNPLDTIQWLRSIGNNEEFSLGVSELNEVVQLLKSWGLEDKFIKISVKLARGLNYYTGTVFETVISEMEDLGSVAGGGRYDNLTSLFSSNKKFPGVGASIGISRLVPKLFEKGLLTCGKTTPAELLVTVQNRKFLSSYLKIADDFRKNGVKTEVYLQDKTLSNQMAYANRRGFNYALIANDDQLQDEVAILRDLWTQKQITIKTNHIPKDILEAFLEL